MASTQVNTSIDGIEQTAVAKTVVTTIPAAVVPAGMLQITARTRSVTDKATGKKTEIATDQRSRSIIIKEYTPNVSSKYTSIVCTALALAAKSQLEQQWEQNPQLREVDTALYSEDAILAFCARENESKKLNGETILAWFKQSDLCTELEGKYNDKQIAKFCKELENIAAPVLSAEFYNEERALKRMVTLAKHPRDAESEIVLSMIGKLQRYVDKIRATRENIGDVEEIDG